MGRMNPGSEADRLSRIATHWSAFVQAHDESDPAESQRNQLLVRYIGAVYRYLLGATRDPDTAGDLCQEFAVRFLRGDFRRANPTSGRFRDYLKSALANLVNDFHRANRSRPLPFPDSAGPAAPAEPADDDFLAGWRQELLEQAWKALAEANPTQCAVLRMRVEHPDLSSSEMADRLEEELGKPMTPENVRKALQRAHGAFADALIVRVAESLPDAEDNELEAELKALDLLKYCQSALTRRRK
jgi:RNA polymerase sigma-70 factor (ECF subfamily)